MTTLGRRFPTTRWCRISRSAGRVPKPGLIQVLRSGLVMTRDQQKAALSAEIIRDYAEGRIGRKQIRHRLGVTDFDLVLLRVGEEGLRLPRADPNLTAIGVARLEEAMQNAKHQA